jgi:hypothetical protein
MSKEPSGLAMCDFRKTHEDSMWDRRDQKSIQEAQMASLLLIAARHYTSNPRRSRIMIYPLVCSSVKFCPIPFPVFKFEERYDMPKPIHLGSMC